MAELKHIKTFESYAENFNTEDVELIDEGVKDFVKKISDKLGIAAEDFLTQWKSPKVLEWAKKMGKSYLAKGTLTQDAYDKALAVNFNPSKEDARDFFVQMARIKGSFAGSPTSVGPNVMPG